jgi:hypothetical protein
MLTHLTTSTPLNLSEHPPHNTCKAACHSAARAPPPGRLGRGRKGNASFRSAPRQPAVQVGARSRAVLSQRGRMPASSQPAGSRPPAARGRQIRSALCAPSTPRLAARRGCRCRAPVLGGGRVGRVGGCRRSVAPRVLRLRLVRQRRQRCAPAAPRPSGEPGQGAPGGPTGGRGSASVTAVSANDQHPSGSMASHTPTLERRRPV